MDHARPTDFEALYQSDPDPFEVRTSWYERRKRQVLLTSLTRERYDAAWDLACGTGDLAADMAARCDLVVATDASPTAVRLTTERCAAAEGRVRTEVARLPELPVGADPFDLVVVSEVLYYLDADERAATVDALLTRLAPDGEVAAVHWRHHPHDAHLSGADVTRELDQRLVAAGLRRAVQHEDTDFVSAHWVRDLPTDEERTP